MMAEERGPLDRSALLLLFCVGFWAVMALAGGVGMASAPDGAALGFQTAWLAATPFGDYLVPGLLLALLGVLSAVLALLLWRDLRGRAFGRPRPAWHWVFGLVVVLVQAVWISGEIVLLWAAVSEMPSDTQAFFRGFWWGFGALTLSELILILTPSARRVLGLESSRGR